MSNGEVLSQPEGDFHEESSHEPPKAFPEHLATLSDALVSLTDSASKLDILDEATERVTLIHEAHSGTLPENGEPDPMHIAFAKAAVVAEVELQKEDGGDPYAVLKALEEHIA